MDKNELKSSLTLQDIEQVLKYFNVDYYYNTQDDIQMSTVCHGGNSHKLYYYPETESFRCYTDCSESFDIYDFIVKVSKTRGEVVNFHEAYKTLGVIAGVSTNSTVRRKIGFGDDSTQTIEDWNWIGNLKRRKKFEPKLEIINEDVLNNFDKLYPKPWYEEGISLETQEKFGIRFDPDYNRTIIPHYNINNELIGIRVRNWRGVGGNGGNSKYLPLYYEGRGFNHPLGYSIYGAGENKTNIKQIKKVLITESEKSVLKSDSFFGEESFTVALAGGSMNHFQAEMLLSLGVETVMIALDKDYEKTSGIEFKKYISKVERIAKLFVNKVSLFHITDTRDVMDYQECVMDRSKEELLNIMEFDKHEIHSLEELNEFEGRRAQ